LLEKWFSLLINYRQYIDLCCYVVRRALDGSCRDGNPRFLLAFTG